MTDLYLEGKITVEKMPQNRCKISDEKGNTVYLTNEQFEELNKEANHD